MINLFEIFERNRIKLQYLSNLIQWRRWNQNWGAWGCRTPEKLHKYVGTTVWISSTNLCIQRWVYGECSRTGSIGSAPGLGKGATTRCVDTVWISSTICVYRDGFMGSAPGLGKGAATRCVECWVQCWEQTFGSTSSECWGQCWSCRLPATWCVK